MPEEPQPPADGTPAVPPTDGSDNPAPPETISLDEARKLRSEAKNLRTRLKQIEDEAKAKADAELPELERLKKQASDAAQERDSLKTQLSRTNAERIAATENALYSDVVASLLDADDMATDKTIRAGIARIKTDRPALFKEVRGGGADGGAGRSGKAQSPSGFMNDLIFNAVTRR